MKLIPLIVVCLGLVALAHAAPPVLDRHPMVCDLTDGAVVQLLAGVRLIASAQTWSCGTATRTATVTWT